MGSYKPLFNFCPQCAQPWNKAPGSTKCSACSFEAGQREGLREPDDNNNIIAENTSALVEVSKSDWAKVCLYSIYCLLC